MSNRFKTHRNLSAVVATVIGGAGLAGCSQDGVRCGTAHGDFAVKLVVKANPNSCDVSAGGIYGLTTYYYPDPDNRPDYNHASLAIQADELGAVVDDAEARLGELPDPANKPYAKGDFDSARPAADDLCSVSTLVAAKQNIPALDADETDPEAPIPAEPAKTFEYAWSNFKVLVTAAANGTQFISDLSITKDGCAVQYEAWGLYPAVYCETDEDCNAIADPDNGRPTGSGINPDYEVACDLTLPQYTGDGLGLCMLKSKPPAP